MQASIQQTFSKSSFRSKHKFEFIDLFAGIGGFRIALEPLGGKCVFSSDWDKYAQETYKAYFGETPRGDITKINEDEIPQHDVLCAGFPCQSFSISGKQRGFKDTRGTLFFDIARIVKFHKPKIVFLENVRNFRYHDKGRTIDVVVKTLQSLGYNVFYDILNASYYGVPQARKRTYILAFRKDLAIRQFEFPQPTYEKVFLKKFLQPNSKAKNQIIKKGKIKIREQIKTPRNHSLESGLAPIRVGTINDGGQGERIYSPEGHAITLSAYGGGVASKTGAYLIGKTVRKLTPYECARVMGFPLDFEIPESVTTNQAYKQFGNSVAIPIIKRIFREIISQTKFYDKKKSS